MKAMFARKDFKINKTYDLSGTIIQTILKREGKNFGTHGSRGTSRHSLEIQVFSKSLGEINGIEPDRMPYGSTMNFMQNITEEFNDSEIEEIKSTLPKSYMKIFDAAQKLYEENKNEYYQKRGWPELI